MKPALIITCAILSMTSIQAQKTNTAHPHGIDPTNMNLSVNPGTDFYKYATGNWNKKNPMPATHSRYGVFNLLLKQNNERISSLIQEMSQNSASETSLEATIGTLYNKVLDSKTLNEQGISPLMHYVKMFNQLTSRSQLGIATGMMSHAGISAFFDLGCDADSKDSKKNLVQISQGGLSLGERDYYLDSDSATLEIRNAYRGYGERVFSRVYPDLPASAIHQKMNDVIQIETRLAQAFSSNAALRIPENNYNKISTDALLSSYPNIQWTDIMKENHCPSFNEVNVAQPEALAEVDRIFANEKLDAIKNYLIFRVCNWSLSFLSDDLRKLKFDFYERTMSGTEEEMPAWNRAVNLIESLMGEALGKSYVAKYFPEAAKQKMETLVSNLQTALGERIKAQDWMSDATKQKALEKLSTFYVKIGYPNKWRDFSDLKVDFSKPLLDNVVYLTQYNSDYAVRTTIGQPVDRERWYMTPQTVNAYYNPTTNEICFPAGILQYPFFDTNADDAFNYGAIGVVIGHEMTHGFDDQGRKFDKDGNMSEWWEPEDSKRFNERAQVIVDFFNNIKVLPGLNADGVNTEGENLADHGGLQVAYTAYRNATRNKPLRTIGGLTPDQRFFIAYAGVWSGDIREAEIRKRIKSDSHSLAEWRVNGTLPHISAWYKAFNITPKDKLYIPQEKRLTIW